ncbi:MAG: NTF2-like N-terminal transpeptidase domain-containing protein, partial [Actinomycetota bacterium]
MIRKGLLALILTAMAVAGGLYLFRNASAESPDRAALAYLAAWQRGDYAAMKKLAVSPPPEFDQIHKDLLADLKATNFKVVPGRITESETKAAAAFKASMSMEGLGEFSYNGRLELVRREDRWFVKWSPASVHPGLQTGLRLARSRKFPARGPILGFDDSPILDLRSAVVVGVEPRRVADRNALVAALQTHLGLDPAKVSATLDAPGVRPDHFYAVAELPEAQYEAVKPAIYPVPGLVFQRKSLRIPPSPEFARHILGSTGEITRELLDQFGRPYLAGDSIGLTGLERVYERRLAG